jgi:uncharacterized protein YbjT (DUF2867 family)
MTDQATPKALVLGATGYTGQEVVRELRRRQVATVAHVRPDSARLAAWRDRFTALGATVDTTPWEEAALAAMIAQEKPTVVFALLGTTRKRKKMLAAGGGDPQTATYEAVDYGLTALAIRAAAQVDPAPRFVYLSAVGVSPTAKGEYYQVRARAEADLLASGLPHIIARPSFITGPDREDDRPAERFGAAAIDGALAVIGALGAAKLRDRFSSLTGGELGRALVELALDPGASGVFETPALRQRAS